MMMKKTAPQSELERAVALYEFSYQYQKKQVIECDNEYEKNQSHHTAIQSE